MNIVEEKIDKILTLLNDLGVPIKELTERRKEKMAKAILSLGDLKPNSNFQETKSQKDGFGLTSREVLRYMNNNYDENIADSSYDDIRRKDLILPVEAELVIPASNKKNSNTNDGTRKFALRDEFAELIKFIDSENYSLQIKSFLDNYDSLKKRIANERNLEKVTVQISDTEFEFSPGKHNDLQRLIIEEFLPRYGYESKVLYIGDSDDKYKLLESDELLKLGFQEISHETLPDIVAVSYKKKWLYLIEAVYTSNPIDDLRKIKLMEMAKDVKFGIIYVSAFLDKNDFRKFSKDIAFNTEAWISDYPDRMIHFNGHKFLGPLNDWTAQKPHKLSKTVDTLW